MSNHETWCLSRLCLICVNIDLYPAQCVLYQCTPEQVEWELWKMSKIKIKRQNKKDVPYGLHNVVQLYLVSPSPEIQHLLLCHLLSPTVIFHSGSANVHATLTLEQGASSWVLGRDDS